MEPTLAQEANAEGMAALRAGNAPVAAAAFVRATQADPGALPLWRNLAHARRLQGDTPGERAALDAALRIDRLDFASQLRMAQLLEREGEETAALSTWSAVFQLAQALPGIAPPLQAELDAGQAYCAALVARLAGAAQRALGTAKGRSESENRRLAAMVDQALGRRRVYHNECAGLFFPFLPEDEYFDRDQFPWFDELEAASQIIAAELAALIAGSDDLLRPYVKFEEGVPESQWSALDGSLDWGACFLWEYGEPNLPIIERCPQTAALLERLPLARIPGRGPNAFFSLLKPHSRIPAHTGVTNVRAIVHLALDIPPGCGFRVGNETREWVEGKAFAFDDTIEHEAWNDSDRRRAILIIDAWNPHLSEAEREGVCAYIAAADQALEGRPVVR
ncbi:aspartyl/asparaginyl beta-hydroxylase [Novosphingobium kunmingense]|uniref:Aspartyl/asparaginyl beta-hydroxylase n=1 Tax=Novosphingobium kunmingense TaxID=1211806 RepID=A0A2N0H4V2_9SPHN|nr:aspartyl/asparaginyl beta-hydroxylase domain-containing protein [Novosphingobium kunmingense]PKB13950.1 aspartyl/asparaginyl beta-hydroxylase [Novosphingobium kunmingense]